MTSQGSYNLECTTQRGESYISHKELRQGFTLHSIRNITILKN